MRKLLWGLAVVAGMAAAAYRRRQREADAAARTWAAHTDPVD